MSWSEDLSCDSRLYYSMDFKQKIMELAASFFIVAQRFVLLIFTPYKTMRKISAEKDYSQIAIILFFVLIYFQVANKAKQLFFPSILPPTFFLINFTITVVFFYIISRIFNSTVNIRSFVFTLSYSLFPTLIWFTTNSLLYRLLPPPRTPSMPGKAFSLFFISFSISLFIWKLILVYLGIRFSSKLNFYKIIYTIILYLCLFIPYSLLLYHFQIFRIPFI